MSVRLPYSLFQTLADQLVWNDLDREHSTCKTIEITEKVSVKVLRATWRPADERLFLIHKGILYLEVDDLPHLMAFPGIDHCSQSENDSRSGFVILSDIAYRGYDSVSDLNTRSGIKEFLLPACARGNQSFAFGHFISELLPDLAAIQELLPDIGDFTPKVITYPLEEWASQLLNMFSIASNLVSPLPQVCLTGFPTYTSYEISARFYRNRNRDSSIAGLLPSNDIVGSNAHSLESLVVLSRASAGSSRPMRWIDIDKCVYSYCQKSPGLQASIVDPAVNGPFAFRSKYLGNTKTLFVSAPGSAVYNVLYLTSCPILIALDAIPLNEFWEGQLADLRPYGNRIIFIANRLTSKIVEWDKPFSLHALPDQRYLNAIVRYMAFFRIPMSCERFITTCGNTYISLPLPPSF
jgi:hypothetical protein